MLIKGLAWRPTEELLKGSFVSKEVRGLHCLNHDGVMLPRENHKSQNSVEGVVTVD